MVTLPPPSRPLSLSPPLSQGYFSIINNMPLFSSHRASRFSPHHHHHQHYQHHHHHTHLLLLALSTSPTCSGDSGAQRSKNQTAYLLRCTYIFFNLLLILVLLFFLFFIVPSHYNERIYNTIRPVVLLFFRNFSNKHYFPCNTRICVSFFSHFYFSLSLFDLFYQLKNKGTEVFLVVEFIDRKTLSFFLSYFFSFFLTYRGGKDKENKRNEKPWLNRWFKGGTSGG